MWSGGYRVPVPTLTGNVQRDMVLIPRIIGFGEIAIADNRFVSLVSLSPSLGPRVS